MLLLEHNRCCTEVAPDKGFDGDEVRSLFFFKLTLKLKLKVKLEFVVGVGFSTISKHVSFFVNKMVDFFRRSYRRKGVLIFLYHIGSVRSMCVF